MVEIEIVFWEEPQIAASGQSSIGELITREIAYQVFDTEADSISTITREI